MLDHYLQITAKEMGVETKTLSAEARRCLERYSWPGNVRELVNLCRRLSVLAPGKEICLADLPASIAGAAASTIEQEIAWSAQLARWAEVQALQEGAEALLESALPEFERTLIRVALRHTGGHRQDAARLLGWGRNTLTRKLKELGLDDAADAADAAA